MKHDLLHIQGKPYVLIPLHEYRMMSNEGPRAESLPQDILDALCARLQHPVKILRKHRGMTQSDLAHTAGLSRPYLTEIETGKKEGSIASLRAIAGALQVDAGLLV